MTVIALRQSRIHAGIWEGILTGARDKPHLDVVHLEAPLAGLQIAAVVGMPDQWSVVFPLPVQALSQGVQTFIFRDTASGAQLAHFTMITGATLESDIRAEVDLLRAELDLLKRAFRRHCVETIG